MSSRLAGICIVWDAYVRIYLADTRMFNNCILQSMDGLCQWEDGGPRSIIVTTTGDIVTEVQAEINRFIVHDAWQESSLQSGSAGMPVAIA